VPCTTDLLLDVTAVEEMAGDDLVSEVLQVFAQPARGIQLFGDGLFGAVEVVPENRLRGVAGGDAVEVALFVGARHPVGERVHLVFVRNQGRPFTRCWSSADGMTA
jgi:hypothetical protein